MYGRSEDALVQQYVSATCCNLSVHKRLASVWLQLFVLYVCLRYRRLATTFSGVSTLVYRRWGRTDVDLKAHLREPLENSVPVGHRQF